MKLIVTFICGLLFGSGLTISNMINPTKIQNFLDITGNWDPSLALVMLSALIITFLGYRLALKNPAPILGEKFMMPLKQAVDKSLVIGSSIFGIGWGLAGYCPGPAITALGLGFTDAFLFVAGMILGLIIYSLADFLFRAN